MLSSIAIRRKCLGRERTLISGRNLDSGWNVDVCWDKRRVEIPYRYRVTGEVKSLFSTLFEYLRFTSNHSDFSHQNPLVFARYKIAHLGISHVLNSPFPAVSSKIVIIITQRPRELRTSLSTDDSHTQKAYYTPARVIQRQSSGSLMTPILR